VTENEKLRALLAEARVLCDYNVDAQGRRELRARIDAALAEPYHIPPDERCFRSRSDDKQTVCCVERTNYWTEENDYCDERNFVHYAPCPLARTWDKP
jgi:hypothetical protein